MQRSILALALLGFSLVAQGATEGPAALDPGMQNPGYQEKPAWFKQSFLDIREDLAEATVADRRLVLYFYQDGCPYCAKLLQEGLGDKTIGTLARQRFDWIAINIWGDREVAGFSGEPTTEKKFAADLKVQFTPTLLLLDEGGKVVMRLNGYYPPHKLEAALTYVAERREQVGETFASFYATLNPTPAKGKLHEEGGFLPEPPRLADNRDLSPRPLVVMFEQLNCKDCDELHEVVLRREPVAYSLTAFDAAIVDAYSKEPIQTPDGREIPAREWAAELGIEYTPSLVFFDAAGREVFRTEGYLKSFHIQGALDYVATGAYLLQPSFQRYLSARREALLARGIHVDLME
jgi:thioredoxin-related protein